MLGVNAHSNSFHVLFIATCSLYYAPEMHGSAFQVHSTVLMMTLKNYYVH